MMRVFNPQPHPQPLEGGGVIPAYQFGQIAEADRPLVDAGVLTEAPKATPNAQQKKSAAPNTEESGK